jgi:hypothetical protein
VFGRARNIGRNDVSSLANGELYRAKSGFEVAMQNPNSIDLSDLGTIRSN